MTNRTIKGLLLVAIVLLVLAITSAAMAAQGVDGGGGYCNPLYLRLGGCEPRVTCDIGHPIIDESEDGYVLKCQQDPQAPEGGNPPPLEIFLASGQFALLHCESEMKAAVVGGLIGEVHVRCAP